MAMSGAARQFDKDRLYSKIVGLPPDRAAEVEDFVDFLCLREADRTLARVVTKQSEVVLEKVWDNPNDSDYDRL